MKVKILSLFLIAAIVALNIGLTESAWAGGNIPTDKIIENYCSNLPLFACAWSCSHDNTNGHITSCRSFMVHGNIASGNYIISQSLFSGHLQEQILAQLRKDGYARAAKMYAGINLTAALVNYIAPPVNMDYGDATVTGLRLQTMAALSNMVSRGDYKDFNHIAQVFAKHLEKRISKR